MVVKSIGILEELSAFTEQLDRIPDERWAVRWAKSYSIIDHEFLHQGYFKSLSLEAMALYFFLVVVGDRDGRSYYAERSIADSLRLSPEKFQRALSDLMLLGLIDFRRPYFWVKNLSQREA